MSDPKPTPILATHNVAIGETFKVDGPDNQCVGCSPHNPRSLGLEFTRTGESTVTARYAVPADLCGFVGIVHGGIQALLLDEMMGVAVMVSPLTAPDLPFATVELRTQFKRPAKVEDELQMRGEVTRREGRHAFVTASLSDSTGRIVTLGEGRWTKL